MSVSELITRLGRGGCFWAYTLGEAAKCTAE